MRPILQKLTSRKLWLAIAGVATGLAVALGASTAQVESVAGTIQAIVGCLTALATAVTYIRTEGSIDAAGVSRALDAAAQTVQAVGDAAAAVKNEGKAVSAAALPESESAHGNRP